MLASLCNRSGEGLGWSLTSGRRCARDGWVERRPQVRRREERRDLGADRYAPEGCQRQGISSAMRAAGCD